ncbi:MAG TPA: hypothetical protein VK081_11875 [Planctomycetota bacterium]|nr:hypothetical protein [Planctomycetota bacterium]
MRRLVALALLLGSLAGQDLTVAAGDARVGPQVVAAVQAMAEDGLRRLARHFPGAPERPIRVVVHSARDTLPPELREHLHEGTAGFALLGRDEAYVLLAEARSEPPNDLRTVVVHELVHVLLDQAAGPAGPFVPRWVHEGLAQELSGGPYLAVQEEDLVLAVWTRTGPRFSRLVHRFPARDDLRRLAYAQSFSFVAYLVDRFGVDKIVEAVRRSRADRPFHLALLDVTGLSMARLQDDWEQYVVFRSGAIARFLLRNCFSLVIILAVPLLVIAVVQRSRRNRARMQQLAEEAEEDTAPLGADEA